jgi:hypothetical protein
MAQTASVLLINETFVIYACIKYGIPAIIIFHFDNLLLIAKVNYVMLQTKTQWRG